MTVLQDIDYARTSSLFGFERATPVIKWAGGKRQLLPEIHKNLPIKLLKNQILTFIEPFFGGGAVFFSLSNNFFFSKKVIIDINKSLSFLYMNIRDNVEDLIEILYSIQKEYLQLDEEKQKAFYYAQRDMYNQEIKNIWYDNEIDSWLSPSAKLLFLNKTGFNGLYRVNASGEFNVPFGSYKNPRICDVSNLLASSRAFSETEILFGDFERSLAYVDENTFVYLDPPYRPLNSTANFNAYSKETFDDSEQIRLAEFCKLLDSKGVSFLLSNSDPKNIDPKDNFFDDLYQQFTIKRIKARRNINSDGQSRGFVSELLIMNYPTK